MDAAPIFEEPREAAAADRRGANPLWIALAVTALVTGLRLFDTVDIDVAWQLWIAGRLHAGAHLYRDIVEVNPPLWFWMAVPVDAAARALGARPDAVLVLFMGGIVALSLSATNRLLVDIAPPRRALLLGYAALALMAMPWVHVGQREQIVLIGTLPYAALVAARAAGARVPVALSVLIGAGAALGFALKHYFLIVPLVLELWLVAQRPREWRLLRPEIGAIAIVGGLYALAIAVFARDYLTNMVPLIRIAYGIVGAPSLNQVFGLFALLGLGILAFVAAHWRLLARAPLASALLVAAAGFALVYFIQSKGWLYHAIPLVGCASLALAALLAETTEPPRMLRILSPALFALPLLFAAQERLHPAEPSPELVNAISGLEAGDSVGFLAVDNAIPWSVTLQHGFRYPSRYMGFWMFNAIVINERSGSHDARLVELGRQIVSETIEDFRCAPPKAIIVARPGPGERGFDILAFFLRDPAFAELMSHYRARPWAGLERYDLASPLSAPQSPCRAGI
jgi:hypothetical protein